MNSTGEMLVTPKLLKGESDMSDVVEDRISNLPASLVHHILSFVDTRCAARTSVLSKRWKYIWRSIPTLHFDYLDLAQENEFVEFVDATLEFHDESNIRKFSLHSDVHLNEPRITKWISTAISHNVEEFSLRLHRRDEYLIPSSLYTCESLIDLRLLSIPDICSAVSFPRLKSFHLAGVEFRDECWNDQLFSNCPVLQYLFIGYCTWSDMENFCISNPALKVLIILNPEEQDGFQDCALRVHAPSLESLIYKGRVAKDYVLCSFPALVEAKVDFFFEEDGPIWDEEIDYGEVISKFLRALAHVVHLTISDRTLQVLSVADNWLDNLPSYHNLQRLCLTQKVTADKALIALLEKAPNLGSLEFEEFVPSFLGIEDVGDGVEDNYYNDSAESEDNNDNEDDGWALDLVAARCSFLELMFVSFNKFTGNAREMRWVKLILKNAKALARMSISCDPNSAMKSENVMADILSLPRSSESCVFEFSPKLD